jgi:hypothetical protein
VIRQLLMASTLTLTAATAVTPPAVAGTGCSTAWGSQPQVDRNYTSATIRNLRAGRHPCFDRLVVDLGPRLPGLPGPDATGYHVEYVPQVIDDPSDDVVPLAGGAFLAVVVRASAYDEEMHPTYSPADRFHAVNVDGFPTFRQVAFRHTFEGQTLIAVGVRARLPFRTFVLPGPGAGSRFVLDVAHRW